MYRETVTSEYSPSDNWETNCFIHTVEYYSAIVRNDLLMHAATQMSLKIIAPRPPKVHTT